VNYVRQVGKIGPREAHNPREEKIRHQIRDELAIRPIITMTALKERVEDVFGRGFDYEYIRKLVDKVRNEIVVEIDRAQIEQRMAFTRENYRVMREELLKIVYWLTAIPFPSRSPATRW
jgi:hypothetical protein